MPGLRSRSSSGLPPIKVPMDRATISLLEIDCDPASSAIRFPEISATLRASLWQIYSDALKESCNESFLGVLANPWRTVMRDWHVFVLQESPNIYSSRFDAQCGVVRKILLNEGPGRVVDFIQYTLRHYKTKACIDLFFRVSRAFETAHNPYLLVKEGPTIIPAASVADAHTVQRAFADTAEAEYSSARAHLRSAAEQMTVGNFVASVRESIHAVESAAQAVTAKTSARVEDALVAFSRAQDRGAELTKQIQSLYAVPTDEKDIRHALAAGAARIDLPEAQYMLGACAAFVSYMIGLART